MAEEKANQREKSYKENIKNLTVKLKQAEARAEFADKSVQKLQKEVGMIPFLNAGDCVLENGCLFQVSCHLLNITTNLMILYDFIDYLRVRWTALRMSWWPSRRSSRPSTRSWSRPSLRCLDTRHNKSGHKTKFKMLRTII